MATVPEIMYLTPVAWTVLLADSLFALLSCQSNIKLTPSIHQEDIGTLKICASVSFCLQFKSVSQCFIYKYVSEYACVCSEACAWDWKCESVCVSYKPLGPVLLISASLRVDRGRGCSHCDIYSSEVRGDTLLYLAAHDYLRTVQAAIRVLKT